MMKAEIPTIQTICATSKTSPHEKVMRPLYSNSAR
jgi:hypothetical protein